MSLKWLCICSLPFNQLNVGMVVDIYNYNLNQTIKSSMVADMYSDFKQVIMQTIEQDVDMRLNQISGDNKHCNKYILMNYSKMFERSKNLDILEIFESYFLKIFNLATTYGSDSICFNCDGIAEIVQDFDLFKNIVKTLVKTYIKHFTNQYDNPYGYNGYVILRFNFIDGKQLVYNETKRKLVGSINKEELQKLLLSILKEYEINMNEIPLIPEKLTRGPISNYPSFINQTHSLDTVEGLLERLEQLEKTLDFL